MADDQGPKHEKSNQVVTRKIAGETILVPVKYDVADMERIYALGEVAAFIWERIDGKHSVDDLTKAVATDFAVDEPTAHRDVLEFVDELLNAELINL